MSWIPDSAFKLRYPLEDLGLKDPRLTRIFSTGFSEEELRRHVHGLFLDDDQAKAYLQKSPVDQAHIEMYCKMLQRALPGFEAKLGMLDIGSGAGATALAAVELFPELPLIATDLALPLLLELRNYLQEASARYPRVSIAQMNCEDIFLDDNQVDLVTGSWILHHARSPLRAFNEVRRVLAPGGRAVFWEAMELGHQMLARIFEFWNAVDPSQPAFARFPPGILDGCRFYLRDIDLRVGRHKTKEELDGLEDKWLFAPRHLRELAAEAHFEDCTLLNIYYDDPQPLRLMAMHEIDRRGFKWEDVPAWATDYLLAVERKCSPDYWYANPFACMMVLS
jgi:ubiquinone/menaquinone biosynthesis C-methylase UbiE